MSNESLNRIYVVDVGSPKRGLAWAKAETTTNESVGGTDLVDLCQRMADDIRGGTPIALGFEAPVFLPVAESWVDLCKGRPGEGRHPWSAGAGASVAAAVIPIAAWILERLRANCGETVPRLSFAAERWPDSGRTLLVWEAFVSGDGHARSDNAHGAAEHIQDAATAALAFRRWCSQQPRPASAVSSARAVNTLAAAALWAGWETDETALRETALVLWPSECLGKDVRPVQPKTP